jgi:UDP-glucose 4-epimerase
VGGVFNVGSDQEVTINDLAKRVIAIAGSSSKVEHLTYQQAYGQPFDDMTRRVPNLKRVRDAIGFAPRLGLDEIITSVIEDQQRQSSRDEGVRETAR